MWSLRKKEVFCRNVARKLPKTTSYEAAFDSLGGVLRSFKSCQTGIAGKSYPSAHGRQSWRPNASRQLRSHRLRR
nr:hypothetical protein CFP56_37338 [Quercus suber]